MEEEAPSSSEQSLPASSEGGATTSTGTSVITGPLGGPLYSPSFVSPLISVREYHRSCVAVLRALQAALDDASIPADDDDLLVADLKIVSDEELVNSALEKMLQEENVMDELRIGTNATAPTPKPCFVQEDVSSCVAEDSLGRMQDADGCMDSFKIGDKSVDVGVQAKCENPCVPDVNGHGPESSVAPTRGMLAKGSSSFARYTRYDNSAYVGDLKGMPPDENRISKNKAQNSSSSTNGEGAQITENASEGNHVLQQKSQSKRNRKRGRPFDRIQRAADLETNGTSFKESHYERIRVERENARAITRLQSLRVKMEQERVSAPSENTKRMQAPNVIVFPSKINTMVVDTFEQISPLEVVFWIDVYHHYVPDERRKRKSQEFLVLGSQLLTAFRDKICCRTDELMQRAHAYVPSGYFLIENVFYNDLRDARAIDYSIPIMDWVKEQEEVEQHKAIGEDLETEETRGKHNKLPVFRKADMASTQFWDLECRVGMRYRYCHQGDCKHDIIIRDMRLLHKEDVQNMTMYPFLRSQFRVRHRMCNICRIYRATKVTYDDKWAPESPCFFCDYCYYLLHYSQEGTLLYNAFKVYDYCPD